MSNEETIFAEALGKGTPPERGAYLDQACAGNAELRRGVEALLFAHQKAVGILEAPPVGLDVTRENSPPCEVVGSTVGPYKLLQQIGEGGMAVVFLAEQVRPMQRKVALKIIKPGMDSRQVIARFEAERQALALMDNPNIAKVLEAGTTDNGRPYFVMELVKGVPITKYCDEHHLTPRDRLELFLHVCSAVQHAHQKGIIHRDLKPSNVLVALYDGKPVPKVIDFGIAKATGQPLTERTLFTTFGSVVGTPEYMSPEQAELNQLDVDTRSDVYSLGVLLYELLTGSTPLEHKRVINTGLLEMLRVIREEEPPRPSLRLSTTEHLGSIAASRGLDPKKLSGLVCGELDWIAMKCLGKDRNTRYASAVDLAADIQRWLRDEPLSIRSPDLGYLLRVWVRRNLGSTGWAISLGVIWGVVAGFMTWFVMLNPLGLSLGLRRGIYLLCVALMGSSGLVNVWLIRPKNAKADLLSGALTSLVAATLCNAISWTWISVLIAGLPYGVWLGTLSSLAFMGSAFVFGSLCAGRLLRQHGNLQRAIWPYTEVAAPSILALIFWNSLAFNASTGRWADWHYFLAAAILCSLAAITVYNGWHWLLRVPLHAAWLASMCVFVARHVGR